MYTRVHTCVPSMVLVDRRVTGGAKSEESR